MSEEYKNLLKILNEEMTNFKISVVNPEAIPKAQEKVAKLAIKISN